MSMESSSFAQRAADLQKLDATEYKPTVAETLEVEQHPPENLTDDQHNFLDGKTSGSQRGKASSARAGNAPLPWVGAQQRLSHPKTLMLSLQILPKAPHTRRRRGSWLRLTSRISSHTRTVQQFWPKRLLHDLFWRKSLSTHRKRKQFLLVDYVNANSFSQKLWSFIRDRTECDLHSLVETHLSKCAL